MPIATAPGMVIGRGEDGRDPAEHDSATATEADTAVTARERWLIRGLLVAAAFAMIATGAPPTYVYELEKHMDGPPVELTADAPRSSFLIRARAVALGPEGSSTTNMALAQISGHISSSGLDSAGALVSVSVNHGTDAGEELNVATGFDTSRQLTFSGSCEELDDSSPCIAELRVIFERTDAGAAGGLLSVDWSLGFEATTPKANEPSQGPLELPWEVEVMAE